MLDAMSGMEFGLVSGIDDHERSRLADSIARELKKKEPGKNVGALGLEDFDFLCTDVLSRNISFANARRWYMPLMRHTSPTRLVRVTSMAARHGDRSGVLRTWWVISKD
jgi:hypothetical protein